jgi:hypothetical protein
LKKIEIENFVFCLVAFDPTEFKTHLAPQNYHQHLSFVKDGENITSNGRKMAKLKGCLFLNRLRL